MISHAAGYRLDKVGTGESSGRPGMRVIGGHGMTDHVQRGHKNMGGENLETRVMCFSP